MSKERLAQEQILFGILLVIAAAAAVAAAAAIAALLAIRLMSKTSASLFLMVKNNSALHDSNGETISFYWETTNLDNLNIPRQQRTYKKVMTNSTRNFSPKQILELDKCITKGNGCIMPKYIHQKKRRDLLHFYAVVLTLQNNQPGVLAKRAR
uniref:Uncharacterized protein n=1 Tax=Glossina palpalis gambiensis TaxID=67801 RepID=A0A1B0B4Q7_9MUSC